MAGSATAAEMAVDGDGGGGGGRSEGNDGTGLEA